MIQLIKGNYINGSWLLDNSLKTKEIINPAKLTEVVGSIQWADKKVVKFVLESANKAKKVWKKMSLENRIILANTLLDKIVKHKSEFAQIITLENGKTKKESLSEVNASVDESRFQIDYLKNHLIEKIDKTEVRYEPIGVVLTITPWNFPLATIMRKMIPAIVCGNSVIVKPSEYAPLTSVFLFELIDEMEFPIGVINLVNGIGSEIVTELLQSDCIKAISFTGSDFTGKKIAKLIGGDDIRFQAEMGGSNAVVVLNDANLKIAVPDIISNGFACGGQWCTGTSRVIAEKGIYNKLIENLKQSAGRINTGNGTKENVDMGPLSNERQFIDVSKKIIKAKKQGAVLELGEELKTEENGYFISPTILSSINNNMDIVHEEVFGPVIMIIKSNDLNDALKIVNNNPFGLSTSIYTENQEKASLFVDAVESGLVHVNLPTAYRKYSIPLMGWKNSGRGLPECGRFMMDLFTKPKAIYRK